MGLYLEYNSGDSIAGCSLSRRKGELNQGHFSDECKEGWGVGCWEVVLRPSERIKILLSKSLRMLPTESPQISSPITYKGVPSSWDGWCPMTDSCRGVKAPPLTVAQTALNSHPGLRSLHTAVEVLSLPSLLASFPSQQAVCYLKTLPNKPSPCSSLKIHTLET